MRLERGDPSKRMSGRQLVRGRKCGSRVGVRGKKEERTRRTAGAGVSAGGVCRKALKFIERLGQSC